MNGTPFRPALRSSPDAPFSVVWVVDPRKAKPDNPVLQAEDNKIAYLNWIPGDYKGYEQAPSFRARRSPDGNRFLKNEHR